MSTLATVVKRLRESHELLIARRQTPVAHKLVASYLNLGDIRFPMDVPLRNGGSVRVFSRGEVKVFWQIFIHQCYRLWPDCKTIVDAGANIGMFSVWAALRLPEAHILSLEPFPETFSKLQHNLGRNQLGTRVQPVRLALAAQSGQRAMSAGAESQRQSLIADDLTVDRQAVIRVPSSTLSEVMDRYGLEQIDLMKMDIEGSEWEVLHSTPPPVLRSIRRLQLEYHEVHARFGYSKEKLFDYLRSTGFQVTGCHEDAHGTGIAVLERAA